MVFFFFFVHSAQKSKTGGIFRIGGLFSREKKRSAEEKSSQAKKSSPAAELKQVVKSNAASKQGTITCTGKVKL